MGPVELKARLEEGVETKAPAIRLDWNGWDPIRRRTRPGAVDDLTFGMLRGLEEKRFAPTRPKSKPEGRETEPACPHCKARDAEVISLFGTQAMTLQYRCRACGTVFEALKY